MIYLNLTNGIELISIMNLSGTEYSFIRIQSTACEQKRWEFILQDLDNNFLMNLAIGKSCEIFDYSAKKKQTRAIYQGLEWIKFVLYRIWFDKEYIPKVKEHNCKDYFEAEYKKLDIKTIKKIKYFKKFLLCKDIKLTSVCYNTKHDGDYEYYKQLLKGEEG